MVLQVVLQITAYTSTNSWNDLPLPDTHKNRNLFVLSIYQSP